jgi:diguanylate cyclase (GGDEF)-like protein
MRFDEVVCRVLDGDRKDEELQLVIGTFPYSDEAGQLIGSCLMLRDVTAETQLQSKYDTKKTESITDALTGLYTRRYFEEWIDQETEFNRRLGVVPPLGILMFDLDKFKSINDTYGHQAGDYVLAQTSRLIKEALRKSDIVGRYGGEEIIVVLPGTTPQGTAIVAEKIRATIAENDYVFNGTKIPVTTSVGASAYLTLEEGRKEVIARADACLYAAKHSGRNVVFCSFGAGEENVSQYLSHVSILKQ